MAQEHSKNTKRALNGNFLLDHALGAELGSFFVKTSDHTGRLMVVTDDCARRTLSLVSLSISLWQSLTHLFECFSFAQVKRFSLSHIHWSNALYPKIYRGACHIRFVHLTLQFKLARTFGSRSYNWSHRGYVPTYLGSVVGISSLFKKFVTKKTFT